MSSDRFRGGRVTKICVVEGAVVCKCENQVIVDLWPVCEKLVMVVVSKSQGQIWTGVGPDSGSGLDVDFSW